MKAWAWIVLGLISLLALGWVAVLWFGMGFMDGRVAKVWDDETNSMLYLLGAGYALWAGGTAVLFCGGRAGKGTPEYLPPATIGMLSCLMGFLTYCYLRASVDWIQKADDPAYPVQRLDYVIHLWPYPLSLLALVLLSVARLAERSTGATLP